MPVSRIATFTGCPETLSAATPDASSSAVSISASSSISA
jgi:hypothetical protein